MIRAIRIALVCALAGAQPAQAVFHDDFYDRTLRIDYYHTGNATSETVTLDRIYDSGTWAGSLVHLTDSPDYGAYRVVLRDTTDGRALFVRGFDSYFKEYQTSSPAHNGIRKTFQESALVPTPRRPVNFVLEKRKRSGGFGEVFRARVDPGDVSVIRGDQPDPLVSVIRSQISGDPHTHADIAIVAEGYTESDRKKFTSDLKRFIGVFFSVEPMKSNRDRFNMYGVFRASAQSGIDEPTHGVYRRTAVGCTFHSLGSERYILTEDNRALRDIAGHVPYDAIYIMINHHRYGGGGIYNLYCTFTTDNQWSEYLMVHEFGHSFFGLADEYYSSSTAYTDFYPKGTEPAEPNITALLDPAHVKWGELIQPGTPIPTPWEKSGYDKIALEWRPIRKKLNDRVAKLRREGARAAEVRHAEQEYDRTDLMYAERMHKYLSKCRFAGKVGVFEGAGYASKGLYRSEIDCIMFSKMPHRFCRACTRAMNAVIRWYSE